MHTLWLCKWVSHAVAAPERPHAGSAGIHLWPPGYGHLSNHDHCNGLQCRMQGPGRGGGATRKGGYYVSECSRRFRTVVERCLCERDQVCDPPAPISCKRAAALYESHLVHLKTSLHPIQVLITLVMLRVYIMSKGYLATPASTET